MRKFFSLVLLLLALASTPAVARPNDFGERRDGFLDRFVQFVSSFFRVQAMDDLLRPPLP